MYSFIRNDEASFHSISRVYNVYDEEKTLKTAFVIGYDNSLEKTFITLLGEGLLNKIGLSQDDIGTAEFIEMLIDFLDIVELMSPLDIVDNKKYDIMSKIQKISKDNIVFYCGSINPFYRVDLDLYNGIECFEDSHAQFLVDEGIFIPKYIENYDDDERYEYDFDKVMEIYLEDEADMGLYSEIDYDKLMRFCKTNE